MASQELAWGALRRSCIQPPLTKPSNATKRHAIYIPQSFFEQARQAIAEADAASTWEFSASVSPTSASSSEYSSQASSPAQEIVIRYRAGMPMQLEGIQTQTTNLLSDDDSSDCDGGSPITFYTPVENMEELEAFPDTSHVAETIENTEIKLIYRQSRHQGLLRTREEAIQVMETHGLREDDAITCHRSGCSDTLRSARDLMFHLHIHDIHEGSLVSCPRCHVMYEDQEDLDVHKCTTNTRRTRTFVTPLKSILTRILSRFSHHK